MDEKIKCCCCGCDQHDAIQERIKEMQYKKEQRDKFLQRYGR